MLDLNFTTVLLLVSLLGILVFVGREFEERYPAYVDYKEGDKTTLVQQLRAGAFVALDYASDVAFPGARSRAISYKQQKRTAEQENQARKTQ